MRTVATLGVIIAAVLVCVAARVYLKQFQSSTLSSTELVLKQGAVRPPVVQDCSSLQRAYKSLIKSRRKEHARIAGTLSEDEVSIYRMVLQKWVAGESAPLKVALQTYPLAPFDDLGDTSCECLSGFAPEDLMAASYSFHNLKRTVLLRKNMRLVDDNDLPESPPIDGDSETHKTPGKIVFADVANGVFSLSEIAFDRGRLHALISYSFQCGMLCGSGRTILLEKVHGQWQEKTECSGWES